MYGLVSDKHDFISQTFKINLKPLSDYFKSNCRTKRDKKPLFTSLQDNLFRNQNSTANVYTGVEEKNMKGQSQDREKCKVERHQFSFSLGVVQQLPKQLIHSEYQFQEQQVKKIVYYQTLPCTISVSVPSFLEQHLLSGCTPMLETLHKHGRN